MDLAIYVPRKGSHIEKTLAPGSGIVADADAARDGRVLCYYEGNLHGVKDMEAYAGKLKQAAGRLVQRYPTSAMAAYEVADLVRVGTYDARRWVVAAVTDPEEMARWSGETLDAVVGQRLQEGVIPWAEGAKAAEGARPLVHGRPDLFVCITKGGQVLEFKVAERTVEVLGEDDPRLADYLPERDGGAQPRM